MLFFSESVFVVGVRSVFINTIAPLTPLSLKHSSVHSCDGGVVTDDETYKHTLCLHHSGEFCSVELLLWCVGLTQNNTHVYIHTIPTHMGIHKLCGVVYGNKATLKHKLYHHYWVHHFTLCYDGVCVA